MPRVAKLYLSLLMFAGAAVLLLLPLGNRLTPLNHGQVGGSATAQLAAVTLAAAPSYFGSLWSGLKLNLDDPLSHLLVQLLIIISCARVAGKVANSMGQPAVVGEMVAGILLGPSLFGLVAPQAFEFVFPPASLGTLKLLSQIGVCVFMFCVGMELDVAQVRQRAATAVLVSHASIVLPYLLGVGLAIFLYQGYAQPGASFTSFALFMGISMSITAFPVLASILKERKLTKTPLGSMAITCAAVDDVTAWCILAFVVAIVRATSVASALLNLGLVLAFLALMLFVIKPLLPRWLGGCSQLEQSDLTRPMLTIALGVMLAAALTTEVIGIHSLFGAFLSGVVMPKTGGFREKLDMRVENFSSVLLLPLFFVFTGLRTQIGLVGDWHGWLLCLGIIGVATLGKLGGSALTARLTGVEWRKSLQLGALMNTRGLMELIALNIGYDLGILSSRIFAMLVLMALVTTMITGPLVTWFGGKNAEPTA